MSKTMKKYEAGKRVAMESEGRIALTIEDSVATLRGEFTRKDRAPLRFKKGAGWRYHSDDSGEFWTLNVSRIADKLGQERESAVEPKVERQVEPSAEPKAEGAVESGALYVKVGGNRPELFKATRSTKASVWLVGPDGKEFRKAVGESADKLAGGFYRVA